MSSIYDIFLYNNYKPILKKGYKLDKKYRFNLELFEKFYQKHLKLFFIRERDFIILCEINPAQFRKIRMGEIEGIELRSFEIMASIMGVNFFDLIIVEDK